MIFGAITCECGYYSNVGLSISLFFALSIFLFWIGYLDTLKLGNRNRIQERLWQFSSAPAKKEMWLGVWSLYGQLILSAFLYLLLFNIHLYKSINCHTHPNQWSTFTKSMRSTFTFTYERAYLRTLDCRSRPWNNWFMVHAYTYLSPCTVCTCIHICMYTQT